MPAEVLPSAGLFGVVTALSNALVQIAFILAKSKGEKSENGQSKSEAAANAFRFEIFKTSIDGVKDDISRLESSIDKVGERAERIERAIIAVAAKSNGR